MPRTIQAEYWLLPFSPIIILDLLFLLVLIIKHYEKGIYNYSLLFLVLQGHCFLVKQHELLTGYMSINSTNNHCFEGFQDLHLKMSLLLCTCLCILVQRSTYSITYSTLPHKPTPHCLQTVLQVVSAEFILHCVSRVSKVKIENPSLNLGCAVLMQTLQRFCLGDANTL